MAKSELRFNSSLYLGRRGSGELVVIGIKGAAAELREQFLSRESIAVHGLLKIVALETYDHGRGERCDVHLRFEEDETDG